MKGCCTWRRSFIGCLFCLSFLNLFVFLPLIWHSMKERQVPLPSLRSWTMLALPLLLPPPPPPPLLPLPLPSLRYCFHCHHCRSCHSYHLCYRC